MIITTNYNIKDWNKIFPDSYNELYAMIDRFLHHVQIMTIKVKVIGERIYQNTGLICGKKYMAKTETVHTRVTCDINEKADKIFNRLGLTTSQAITLFLTASVNNNGLPFNLTLLNEETDLAFAKSIAAVDGATPSQDAQRIMRLYSRGEIDYETAEFAIARLYK